MSQFGLLFIQKKGFKALSYRVLSESADERDKIDTTLSDMDTAQRGSEDEDYAEAQAQYVLVSRSHQLTL